ncbi:hypothetical protein WCU84_20020 [Dickeya chrysanthemi]|uniref:Uncharacterized protein n=1 Tax=Dickeya chrysanthemi TaxID=556 RepID=A0ABU8JS34_DICCH
MNILGIRVKPCSVVIAIYDSDENAIVNVEEIKIPKALPTPEALKYIRNSILDILREFNIEKAGLRIIESNSQTLNIRRIEIEGVIQEAFASSMLSSYFCGQISTIAAKLEMERADFKLYVEGKKSYEPIEGWEQHSKEEKEAILTSLGASNA